MPSHDYRCPAGHVTELHLDRMSDDVPTSIDCAAPACPKAAARVWQSWAATHYKGPGTYTTDYKSKFDRKRRRNPGDSLPIPSEAFIGRADGAEYDIPRNAPAAICRTDSRAA